MRIMHGPCWGNSKAVMWKPVQFQLTTPRFPKFYVFSISFKALTYAMGDYQDNELEQNHRYYGTFMHYALKTEK